MVDSSYQWSKAVLTTEYRAAIGSVAVESTYCEQWVESLIWALLKIEEPQGKFLTQSMQMQSRLELLCNLGKPVLDATESKKFVDLISKLKEANNERNIVIHGNWDASHKNKLLVLMKGPDNLPPAIATKRRPNKPPQTLSAADIEGVAQKISNLTGELSRMARTWKLLA